MKTTSILIPSVLGLILSAATVPLHAEPADAPPRAVNREEIRRQLRELPPEERRALIMELRGQQSTPPGDFRPDAPPPVNREEIRRQLQDMSPEERRARLMELRGRLAAQPDARPDERRSGPREFQPGERPQFRGPRAGQPGGFAPMFERVLTDEQRASFREAMESQGNKLRELNEKLHAARREAFESSVAEAFKEKTVRQNAMAVAKLEAEMTVLRARALSQVKPALSAEQIERLRNLPAMNGGAPIRPQFQRDEPGQRERPERGPRDGQDLPPRPRPER
jgi:Spy/CpxP family protein refolding chaperone